VVVGAPVDVTGTVVSMVSPAVVVTGDVSGATVVTGAAVVVGAKVVIGATVESGAAVVGSPVTGPSVTGFVSGANVVIGATVESGAAVVGSPVTGAVGAVSGSPIILTPGWWSYFNGGSKIMKPMALNPLITTISSDGVPAPIMTVWPIRKPAMLTT